MNFSFIDYLYKSKELSERSFIIVGVQIGLLMALNLFHSRFPDFFLPVIDEEEEPADILKDIR